MISEGREFAICDLRVAGWRSGQRPVTAERTNIRGSILRTVELAWLGAWVEGALHWQGTDLPFVLEIDRRNAREAAEQALGFYHRL